MKIFLGLLLVTFVAKSVEIKDLKLYATFEGAKGLRTSTGETYTGQYLVSTKNSTCAYPLMPIGTFLIKGTTDKTTTLKFDYSGGQEVTVALSAGMTELDTAEAINKELSKDGYKLTFDHSSPSKEVFRFETIKGTRPPVIRDKAEIATFRKILEYSGKVYAEFHMCKWICRPSRYTNEFASLGLELNNFIENGKSSLTYQEITDFLGSFNLPGKGFILPAVNAWPNYEYTRRDVDFYRQGARLRYKNRNFSGERVGIYIGTARTGDPFNLSDREPGHAVLTIDPDKKVLIYEKIHEKDILAVTSDVEYDYKALP